ncbi:MAG: AraC family transcriptional regulator [Actinomycetota bacterium]|nr:AraC family transcriptional regulator [Actinomycetota bacterium]
MAAEAIAGLMTAVEATRTLPTSRAVFPYVKVVHVLDGAAELEDASGTFLLRPGSALALGSGRWCRILPTPQVRLWTVYAEESFFRTQMAWFLPSKERVRFGVHPHNWDGSPSLLHPGLATLHCLEPIWRQMSVMHDGTNPPESVAVRTVELLAKWMRVVLPVFGVLDDEADHGGKIWTPVNGQLVDSTAVGQIAHATALLRERMEEPWSVAGLARAVALSRTHMTRLFTRHTGVSPMRYLTEVRLTEFTRLVEETDFSVARAASAVGWSDPRIASAWFRRRFGIMPSQYRLNPHPHCVDEVVTRVVRDEAPCDRPGMF